MEKSICLQTFIIWERDSKKYISILSNKVISVHKVIKALNTLGFNL